MPGPTDYLSLAPTVIAYAALYERRSLWHHPDFQHVSRALALIGTGLLLLAPITSPLGQIAHHSTGLWHLEDMTGMTIIVIGVVHLIAHMLAIFDETGPRWDRINTIPTAAIGTMWACFAFSDMNATAGPAIGTIGGTLCWFSFTGWLALAIGFLGWRAIQAVIHATGPSLKVARLYTLGAMFGFAACAHRMVECAAVWGALDSQQMALDYLLRSGAILSLAAASHASYKFVTRPLQIPDTWPAE